MEHLNKRLQLLINFFLIFHLLWFIVSKAQAPASSKQIRAPKNSTASALFVFGDSTSDPGNNNYVATVFRGNFLPYGRDFANRKPTGRFTNGRLGSDFIASYLGLKEYVPPYLDPTLSTKELMTGVSFASAGSGYDPFTPQIGNVIPVLKQLEYFKEYKKRVELEIGKQKTEEHIKRALFFVSAGTNDFVVNYFTVPMRGKSYTVAGYQQFVIQHVKHFLQGLWAEGARRMAVVGLPPMGCLPIVITLKSAHAVKQRGCLDGYCSVAQNYNNILQNEMQFMHNSLALSGARISYIDIYKPLMEMIQGPKKFGFDEIFNGCCGSGYLEVSFLCNPLSYTCPDATKYMFWDSIHPTEMTYYYLFKATLPVIDFLLKGCDDDDDDDDDDIYIYIYIS